MESEKQSIDLIVNGEKKSYYFLKIIQNNLENFLQTIRKNPFKVDCRELKIKIDRIETNSELNYYFLKELKDKNIVYKDNDEKWDYKSNLKMLKETLTQKHYRLLENKEPENSFKELQEILIAYSLNYKGDHTKLLPFIQKYEKLDVRLNFPLITAIERKRLEYYKTLLFENDITQNCIPLDWYFENMHRDTDIINYSLDDIKFSKKTYLLILTLTEGFTGNEPKLVSTFFSKNLINENLNELKYVKYEEGKFYAFNSLEKKEIEPNDYILRGLDIDIEKNYYFPLKILLLRNESFQKFSKNGGKGFLEDLGLYDDFIDYLKKFIKSNSFKELIKSVDEYKNIGILLDNEEYINEMLDETHFEFLPFYGASNIFGYTNKDIMISFVNSIPEITKNIRIYYKNEIENITNICLLFTIAVKFISSLHEFIIHLTYSYLNYVTEKELEAKSKKESLDSSDDGGFFFEKKLKGDTKFEFLNINNVVNLLDGISFNKTLEKFQNDLKCKFNYDDLINKMENKNYNGFLKKFLGKYKIDFSYFKKFKNKNPKISCRVKNGVGISMFRDGNDSYGGSEATKKSKEFEILSMNSDKQ